MDINIIFLAITLSIDALGIGISYGVRGINIPLFSKFIISIQTFLIITISLFLGNIVFSFFPTAIRNYTGVIILIALGIFMIIEAYLPKKEKTETVRTFSIKQAGITIKIIKSPPVCDFNKSNKIEPFEALYLGLALSIDSFGVSFGSGAFGVFSIFLPLFAVFFQILFLSIGISSGRKISNISKLSENIWITVSGCILIFMGILKLI